MKRLFSSADPLYLQLREALMQVIIRSESRYMPGEREIMGKFKVSRTTVRKALEELVATGYLKPMRGRGTEIVSRPHGFSGQVLAVMPENRCMEPYQYEVFMHLTKRLDERGVFVVFKTVDEKRPLGADAFPVDRFDVKAVLLFSGLCQKEDIHGVLERKAGQVYVVCGKTDRPYNYIDVDTAKGFELVAAHLAERGHRKIAYVGLTSDKPRLEGIKAGLGQRGLALDMRLAADCYGYRHDGHTAALELLGRGLDFTAVIAHNDLCASGVMEALTLKGLRVPEDVSVTGYDNIAEAERYPVPLTTVGASPGLVATKLVETILGRNDGELARIDVEPSLFIRKSTAETRK